MSFLSSTLLNIVISEDVKRVSELMTPVINSVAKRIGELEDKLDRDLFSEEIGDLLIEKVNRMAETDDRYIDIQHKFNNYREDMSEAQ